jgi:hypothetical protein
MLELIAQSAYKTDSINLEEDFWHVRMTEPQAGETLIEAGALADMVNVHLDSGFGIIPLYGYASFSVQAWNCWEAPI